MTPHFHRLAVARVQRETPDAISVVFAVPPELGATYRFTPGQHLTLRAELGGREVRRSYSICSGADDGILRVAIKQVDGGVFSTWANAHLAAGMELDVMSPDGRFFTALDPAQRRHYVAFAAGSGITPVLSPAWTTAAISDAGRSKLRAYGIAPPGPVPAGGVRPVRFAPRTVACPQCDSVDTERIAEFGSTACKAQYRCRACREPFDYFKPL